MRNPNDSFRPNLRGSRGNGDGDNAGRVPIHGDTGRMWTRNFPAMLLAKDGLGNYAFQELCHEGDINAWNLTVFGGGRKGTLLNSPAHELNNQLDVPLRRVIMIEVEDREGFAYYFQCGCPTTTGGSSGGGSGGQSGGDSSSGASSNTDSNSGSSSNSGDDGCWMLWVNVYDGCRRQWIFDAYQLWSIGQLQDMAFPSPFAGLRYRVNPDELAFPGFNLPPHWCVYAILIHTDEPCPEIGVIPQAPVVDALGASLFEDPTDCPCGSSSSSSSSSSSGGSSGSGTSGGTSSGGSGSGTSSGGSGSGAHVCVCTAITYPTRPVPHPPCPTTLIATVTYNDGGGPETVDIPMTWDGNNNPAPRYQGVFTAPSGKQFKAYAECKTSCGNAFEPQVCVGGQKCYEVLVEHTNTTPQIWAIGRTACMAEQCCIPLQAYTIYTFQAPRFSNLSVSAAP